MIGIEVRVAYGLMISLQDLTFELGLAFPHKSTADRHTSADMTLRRCSPCTTAKKAVHGAIREHTCTKFMAACTCSGKPLSDSIRSDTPFGASDIFTMAPDIFN